MRFKAAEQISLHFQLLPLIFVCRTQTNDRSLCLLLCYLDLIRLLLWCAVFLRQRCSRRILMKRGFVGPVGCKSATIWSEGSSLACVAGHTWKIGREQFPTLFCFRRKPCELIRVCLILICHKVCYLSTVLIFFFRSLEVTNRSSDVNLTDEWPAQRCILSPPLLLVYQLFVFFSWLGVVSLSQALCSCDDYSNSLLHLDLSKNPGVLSGEDATVSDLHTCDCLSIFHLKYKEKDPDY